MAKMMALQKPTAAAGAKLIEAEIPKCGPLDVLVSVKATSICGTDVHIYEWDAWAAGRIKPPLIFGHEMAGEVIEVGNTVKGFSVGDHVSAETHISCGACFQCRTGNSHICEQVKILGVDTQGVFAEYVALPASNAWKNDKSFPHDVATAQEPLGNAVHTVFDGDDANLAGQTVTMFGCGPIGTVACAVCKAAGANKVIAIDINDYKLSLAKKFGADVLINASTQDVVKEVLAQTNGKGADVFLEMSGAPSAFSQGLKSLRAGGRASILGIPSKPVEINLATEIVFKSAKIQGINGRLMYKTWYRAASLLSSGKVKLQELVTHKFPMSEFEKAFETMMSGKSGKIVMYPGK
ncbi:L-threonine 3-dehydrogenase [Candidatus Micrarchaeota archaeon]|nr:L-threonine 3-dehydrogenase [Candidatus Micrarchaeota archaeon]